VPPFGTPQRTLTLALAAALALGGAGCQVAIAPTVPDNALQQLDELTVAASGSMRGYSRDRFPHWRETGGNCNVRDTVLARDGQDLRLSGCNVVGGRWYSPYEDRWFDSPDVVDIDHMVPLANAWRSGAAGWTDEARGNFANDLDRPELIAVSRSINRAKGDQDPSQWRPPNRNYWCKYAQSWIAVKHHWKLTVTTAEKAALRDMVETCGQPTSSPAPAA
jgi:hypothetical protein